MSPVPPNEKTRYYVVKHTFTCIHKGQSWSEDPEDDHLGRFHFAENSCSRNVILALAARDGDSHFCNTCVGHDGRYVDRYESLEDAKLSNPGAIDLEARPDADVLAQIREERIDRVRSLLLDTWYDAIVPGNVDALAAAVVDALDA